MLTSNTILAVNVTPGSTLAPPTWESLAPPLPVRDTTSFLTRDGTTSCSLSKAVSTSHIESIFDIISTPVYIRLEFDGDISTYTYGSLSLNMTIVLLTNLFVKTSILGISIFDVSFFGISFFNKKSFNILSYFKLFSISLTFGFEISLFFDISFSIISISVLRISLIASVFKSIMSLTTLSLNLENESPKFFIFKIFVFCILVFSVFDTSLFEGGNILGEWN
mmetsp:Transcript_8333/g.8307  ORF Transcript_8333/g.8307 Transcript_8333/m.8307 type:complete len:222 (-) Transcript_8333:385-1050(-)